MKLNIKQLIICIAIPLLIGSLSAFLTRDNMTTFSRVIKPPLSPPGILFPIVWTVLYTLMGIASYLIISSDAAKEDVQNAIFVYALQLGINFFWSIFFFNLQWYLFSFFWLLLLWTFILYTKVVFYRISKPAAYLLIPYLLWVTFAGYLNLGIAILN